LTQMWRWICLRFPTPSMIHRSFAICHSLLGLTLAQAQTSGKYFGKLSSD
jgi:hypothetical protein